MATSFLYSFSVRKAQFFPKRVDKRLEEDYCNKELFIEIPAASFMGQAADKSGHYIARELGFSAPSFRNGSTNDAAKQGKALGKAYQFNANKPNFKRK